MGKRGQAKRACQFCTRRKIACDLGERKKKGFQQCTSCRRRKQDCVEIGKEQDPKVKEVQESTSHVERDTYPEESASTEQDLSIQIQGVKSLDVEEIKKAIENFFSSKCFLSRTLLHWKTSLLEHICFFPSLNSMDPICLLIEAVTCYGITLDRLTASSFLSTRTALACHLKSSLERILMNDSPNLQVRTLREMNAILASSVILFDVWLDAGIYYPISLLPHQSDGKPLFSLSILSIPVVHMECLARVMELILFEMGGFESHRQEDIGDCSNNLMLYWYIYLADAFSVANAKRFPIVHQDTVDLLKSKQKAFGFRMKDLFLATLDKEDDEKFGLNLVMLGDLAAIWWQIGSLWKKAIVLPGSVSPNNLQDVLFSLDSWNQRRLLNNSAELHDQDPFEHCVLLLHKYSSLKLYMFTKECGILDRTDVESKLFANQIRSNSLFSWQAIVDMVQQLESTSIRLSQPHILLSQSRIMVSCILDCTSWGLERLSESESVMLGRDDEKNALLIGSKSLLNVINRYGEKDAYLGLDTLDALSRMGQAVHELSLKGSTPK